VRDDSRLWHWTFDGSSIATDRVDPATEVVGVPALIERGSGWLDVFVRRSDGGLQHVFRRGNSWSTEPVGTTVVRGFPSAVAATDGSLHVYARGMEGELWDAGQWGDGASWTFTSVVAKAGAGNVIVYGSPSAHVDGGGTMQVVARSSASDLALFTSGNAGGWSFGPVPRPAGTPPLGTTGFALSPVSVSEGAFALGLEGNLWFRSSLAGWSWKAGSVR
jgi:hypothetical protein